MALCPHCQSAVGLVRGYTASPAFPAVCRNCGGQFHRTGSLQAIFVATAALILGLSSVVLLRSEWLAAVLVVVALMFLAVLARHSTLVPSVPRVVWQWRVAIGVLLLIAGVWEAYSAMQGAW